MMWLGRHAPSITNFIVPKSVGLTSALLVPKESLVSEPMPSAICSDMSSDVK